MMNTQRGFTLVEMAIVLLIMGLAIGGGIAAFSTLSERANTAKVRKQMEEITNALIGYAQVHSCLPCAAVPTGSDGTDGRGTANPCNTQCSIARSYGVIPWATLGVKETDPWGGRFSYRVTREFTGNAIALATNGTITIVNDAGDPMAEEAVAVIISHGRNQIYAYLPSGAQVPLLPGMPDDPSERENRPETNDTFVGQALSSSDFDDLVTWIGSFQLKRALIEAGRLP
ncbi:type II secretion system protein [Desulfonatronum sp. SC1]|uniref:type II secretion system protein n=1 Tax=Desulfonatronum sp. SC1 TaxID=2109626 RepID=UPI00130480BD|nr:type II secretion system protein [Desulfonatronum sp. SC1]